MDLFHYSSACIVTNKGGIRGLFSSSYCIKNNIVTEKLRFNRNTCDNILFLYSNERKKKVKVLVAELCLTLCDPMDYSSSVSMGFSRLEYWSGLSYPFPEDLQLSSSSFYYYNCLCSYVQPPFLNSSFCHVTSPSMLFHYPL